MVIPDRNLIFYACIGRESIIVAEFFFNSNSNSSGSVSDPDLGSFAAKCLELTPPFHSVFSHTTSKRTCTFLIYSPFVFFGIFHHKIDKSQALYFLNCIKNHIFSLKTPLEDTSCFQPQLNLLFHQLLPLPPSKTIAAPPQQLITSNSLSSEDNSSIRLKRKTPLLSENNLDISHGDVVGVGVGDGDGDGVGGGGGGGNDLIKELSVQNRKNRSLLGSDSGQQHKAKTIWTKQVWVLLSLDLIVCSILFFTWLWICRGLKCIHG